VHAKLSNRTSETKASLCVYAEKERQRELERQRKEQRKKERLELHEENHHMEPKLSGHDKFDPETMENEHVDESANTVLPPSLTPEAAQPDRHDIAHVAHARANEISHGEAVSCLTSVYEFKSNPRTILLL
jgi:DNA replication initiation complex subunit (GINS family)